MRLIVRPWLYRLVWITVAVIGAISALGLVVLLLDQEAGNEQGRLLLIAVGVFGALMLIYAIRRLLRPLKAPPSN
jgi:hypothetical protein